MSTDDITTIILESLDDGSNQSAIYEGAPLLVGRSEDAQLHVSNSAASRSHASIRVTEEGGVWIDDLKSRMGTQLNWMRIDSGETARIRTGDRLRIGTQEFTVRIDGKDGPEDEAPPKSIEKPTSVTEDQYQTRGSLLIQLNAGETIERELSWETFWDRYVPLIKGFARRAGAGEEESDDIAQEVMTNFFKSASRFEYDPSAGRFRGYLKACTLNAMRSRWRRQNREVDIDAGTDIVIADENHAEHEWEQEWIRSAIARALDIVRRNTSMSEQSWEAFELYGRREIPITEVAEQLSMTPEAIRQVKSRISRLVRVEIERIRIEEG